MSNQQQLAVTYDVSNEFFRLWLDERMMYSCALFLHPDDSLEQAQANKLAWFHDKLQLDSQSCVLDIGCGWGGALDFMVLDKGLKDATGITLSHAQYDAMVEKNVKGVSALCVSYKDFAPQQRFDAAFSIGMFEHLATSEEARNGESIHIYRDYFRRVKSWTKPGALFGLQSVISLRIPRDREALQEIGWTTENIFPGAISPRLETVVAAAMPHWEIMELHTRRSHYERTAAEWLSRLRAHERQICAQWGKPLFLDYERYLNACVQSFANGYQSLVQLILRRVD